MTEDLMRKASTIYDVARLAGVSPSTVSRALGGTRRVAPATWRRIDDAVRALDYRSNSVARSLTTRSTDSIAILLPDITISFFPQLVKEIQLTAEARGYSLILCNTQDDPARELAYLDLLRRKQVDGLLLVGLSVRVAELAAAVEGMPLVCLDPDVNLPGVPVVQVDNRRAAREATQHLVSLGHRRIAHLAGTGNRSVSRERLHGYREALEEARIRFDPSLVRGADFTEEGGARATRELLDAGTAFTAIFAANDQSAIGAMSALRAAGLEIPDAVSVVGFDDIHPAAYVRPSLTTIREPVDEIATRAVDVLIQSIRSREAHRRRRVRIGGELVVRESSRRLDAAGPHENEVGGT